MMNDHIRSRQLEQPFSFKHIKPYPNSRQEVKGPCVVMATPGTLEGGLSGRLMAQWCSSGRNGVILTGFLPEGTPAKELTRKGKVCVCFSVLYFYFLFFVNRIHSFYSFYYFGFVVYSTGYDV
jgi:Cft2 family RNA processing exonuclease